MCKLQNSYFFLNLKFSPTGISLEFKSETPGFRGLRNSEVIGYSVTWSSIVWMFASPSLVIVSKTQARIISKASIAATTLQADWRAGFAWNAAEERGQGHRNRGHFSLGLKYSVVGTLQLGAQIFSSGHTSARGSNIQWWEHTSARGSYI